MSTFPFQKMDAYLVTKQMAELVHRANIRHKELRDQAERAATSAFLRMSEGLPSNSPGMRKRYFDIARDSVAELSAAIDLALSLGAIDAASADAILDRAGRTRAMLIGLTRKPR